MKGAIFIQIPNGQVKLEKTSGSCANLKYFGCILFKKIQNDNERPKPIFCKKIQNDIVAKSMPKVY